MALTLDDHGYRWDYESALPMVAGAAPFSDKGVGVCHGGSGWGFGGFGEKQNH
jgi:hypothetical protein